VTTALVTIAAGRGTHLGRLLDGVARQHRPPDELVVVDLDPTDDAVRRATERRGVRRVAVPPGTSAGPLPLAVGRNLGAAETTAEQVVVLDVDCIPARDLVARYASVVADHPDGLACGPVRHLRERWADGLPDGPLDDEVLVVRSDAPAARPAPPSTQRRDDHDLFWSLSFGLTRATWDRLGGFDERFVGYGGEDTDLAWRARDAGIPLVWFAGGTAFHQWHPPTRWDPDRLEELVANARRVRDRWGTWPMVGWLHELAAAGRLRFDPDADVLERA
jgi:N-acetylglucosaminyl-diphospho-decaprenol L-rhamnosyltransferase